MPDSFPERDIIGTAVLALAIKSRDTRAFETNGVSEWFLETVSGTYWPLFAEACAQLNQPTLAVRLYETWFGKEDVVQLDGSWATKLLSLWKHYYFTGNHEALMALTQAYSDLGSYALADLLYNQMNRSLEYDEESASETDRADESAQEESNTKPGPTAAASDPPKSAEELLAPIAPLEQKSLDAREAYLPASPDVAQRILELFVDDKKGYGREEINPSAERAVQIVGDSLTVEGVLGHLRGEYALSTLFVDEKSQVTCVAFDIDIVKKVTEDPATDLTLKKRDALHIAQGLMRKAARMGLNVILEDSGKRGYHIWLPVDGSIPLADAVELTLLLVRDTPNPLQKEITVERIPNVKRVRPETKPRMYIGENESAKFWLTVLNNLKNRGVTDMLIVSVDGLTGETVPDFV